MPVINDPEITQFNDEGLEGESIPPRRPTTKRQQALRDWWFSGPCWWVVGVCRFFTWPFDQITDRIIPAWGDWTNEQTAKEWVAAGVSLTSLQLDSSEIAECEDRPRSAENNRCSG